MPDTGDKLPFVLDSHNQSTVYRTGIRPALELDKGIAFVLNISRLAEPPHPLEIAPGHELRKASDKEVLAIKDVIKGFYGDDDLTRWECERVPGEQKGERKFKKLPEEQWRYFVISFSGNNGTVSELEKVLCVCDCNLRIGFTIIKWVFSERAFPALVFEPGRLFQHLQGIRNGSLRFVEATEAEVRTIRDLLEKIKRFDHDGLALNAMIEQCVELEAFPQHSPLLFLGYFALLESILTHQPRKNDTIDSITRQIIKKVALLNNRWANPLDYSKFMGAKPETIWAAMYSYRSCLAHGGRPDFEKELRVLHDRWNALQLLKQTVKLVLRQLLSEPQLIADLRNC